MFEWIVPCEESGKKLVLFLKERLGDRFSAKALKRLIEQNNCKINGRTERFASFSLAKGDHIILNVKDIQLAPTSHLEFESDRILFEDESLLIYDKPPHINCDDQGILKLLKTYNSKLRLIHRLDKDTTGVLLFAKDPDVFQKMVEAFRELQVSKTYVAIVDGIIEKNAGHIENYLGKKHIYQGQAIWGATSKEKGLSAITDWLKIAVGDKATMVFCFPKTGRTHQLRVHLSEMKHPILGDFQYCKRFSCLYQPERILLHAYKVNFVHPVTGKNLEIKAHLPKDFIEAQKKLFGKISL